MDEKNRPEPRGLALPVIVATPEPMRIKVLLADPGNYSRTKREPEFIVLHATHGAEGPNADTNGAFEISKPLPAGKRRSAHYFADSNSITRCVPDLYTAYHAGRTANSRGLGVEICGRADQTRDQWFDKHSFPTLCNTARLVADLCKEFKIPAIVLSSDDLKARKRGITTHLAVRDAWKETVHWDPGPGFPIDEFIDAVRRALGTVGVA